MSSRSNQLLNSVLRGVHDATETSLRLQQQLILGWTRFLPGFTGRRNDLVDIGVARHLWSDSVVKMAHAQRDLIDQQFDAAIAAFDAAMGLAPSRAVAEQRRPQSVRTPAAPSPSCEPREETSLPAGAAKHIYQEVAVVTGAASGIGQAVSRELANRGAKAVLLVDRSDAVHELAASINECAGRPVAAAKIGDTADEAFRKRVFDDAIQNHGLVTICVPAAGITRDALAVRIDKDTGRAETYPIETFRQVIEVNLVAPIYWGIEMIARIAEDRWQRGLKRWEPEEKIQGVVVLLGSVSSQGNKGQISYAVAKAGLEGAAATLMKEAMFHGVRCAIIHPGFTDTPMARALGEDHLKKYVLPYTQLRRLIRPEEIADAICFMISNSAVSGELWADAGWHPPA